MKMKKLFLLFSMITVLFSLTACSNGQGEVTFDYTDNDVIANSIYKAILFQNVDDRSRAYLENEGGETEKATLSNFDVTRAECGEFVGYLAKDETEVLLLENIEAPEDEEAFLNNIYSTVEENGDTVVVKLKAVYEARNVEFKFVYEADPTSAYNEERAPFKMAEFTPTPEYTLAEKMKKAGSNTLMGMGTVFIVLIFISLIISQFERISKIGNKKTEKTSDKAVSSASAAPAVSGNPMDDKQLVAVITAAIMAANGSAGSSDKLIVRSIKKAKR